VVLGTDYPFFIADFDPISSVDRASPLAGLERAAVLGGNALRLLGLSDTEAS
jgi:hypothetical protein